MTVLRLEASMPLAERTTTVDRFRASGGVLLTTAAAIEGLDLAFVEQCIHYDLPANLMALEQRVGRFLRVGRMRPFRSVALRDSQAALTWEEQVFAELGQQTRTT
jgi:superfamily II DNA/RNA helicase